MRGLCRRFIGGNDGRLRVAVRQEHEAVMERSCEDSAVKC
jgi:hypothetical protein